MLFYYYYVEPIPSSNTADPKDDIENVNSNNKVHDSKDLQANNVYFRIMMIFISLNLFYFLSLYILSFNFHLLFLFI